MQVLETSVQRMEGHHGLLWDLTSAVDAPGAGLPGEVLIEEARGCCSARSAAAREPRWTSTR